MKKIRVLITDDHELFRRALRYLLEADPAIDVIGEASNGQEACDMAKERLAQVVCVDWRMAEMDGIETIQRLITVMPQIKIIALSAGFEHGTEAKMLAAGADIYINKEDVSGKLLPAIHAFFPRRKLVDGVVPHSSVTDT
ncbi:MAG: response regulator transcription factor [Glaciimonas sp.]|nr:response regulator transcription factor [Glaciimonas sp.]